MEYTKEQENEINRALEVVSDAQHYKPGRLNDEH